jgi:hypothetical protein
MAERFKKLLNERLKDFYPDWGGGAPGQVAFYFETVGLVDSRKLQTDFAQMVGVRFQVRLGLKLRQFFSEKNCVSKGENENTSRPQGIDDWRLPDHGIHFARSAFSKLSEGGQGC